jgi:flagellar hook-length control protein FliK
MLVANRAEAPDSSPGARRALADAAPAVQPDAGGASSNTTTQSAGASTNSGGSAAGGAQAPSAATNPSAAQTTAAAPAGDAAPATPLPPAPGFDAASASGLSSIREAVGEAARQAPNPAPTALRNAPPAAGQVFARITERFDGRAQRFEMRLDPPELGRVDVRIEIGANKRVNAVLAAHDSAALTDLMRGSRALERALVDAGIDLADNGLQFELSGDKGNGARGQSRDSQPWRQGVLVSLAADVEPDVITAAPYINSGRYTRLNLVA